MTSPWTLCGIFRIKGDPNMVQVQFGPFSRPLTEREYLARRLEPAIEELPWQGVVPGFSDMENSSRRRISGPS